MNDLVALFERNRIIDAEAQKAGIDPNVVHAMIGQESAGNPNAISNKGAMGLMQLMPGTAAELGVDPKDPAQNIHGGVTYYKQMLDRFGGDQAKALAAYNAGPGAVQKYGGIPPFPETQDYVQRIQSRLGPPQANDAAPSQASPAPPQQDLVAAFEAGRQQPGIIDRTIQGVKDIVMHPVDNLPLIGGGVGGIVGGIGGAVGGLGVGGVPGALGGATVGAAGGEAWKQLINRFIYGEGGPETPGDAATSIGKEAVVSGFVPELAGQALAIPAKALIKGAVGSYTRALKAGEGAWKSTNAFRETGSKALGQKELSTTLLENNLPLWGSSFEKGWDKVGALAEATRDAATATGQRARAPDVLQPLVDSLAPQRGKMFNPGEAAKIAEVGNEYLNNPAYRRSVTLPSGQNAMIREKVPLDELLDMLKDNYREIRGMSKQAFVQPEVAPRLQGKKLLAQGMRDELSKVPGLDQSMKAQSELIPALGALNDALPRIGKWNVGGLPEIIAMSSAGASLGPLGLLAGPIMRAARDPRVYSPVAIAAYKTGKAVLPAAKVAGRALSETARLNMTSHSADDDDSLVNRALRNRANGSRR